MYRREKRGGEGNPCRTMPAKKRISTKKRSFVVEPVRTWRRIYKDEKGEEVFEFDRNVCIHQDEENEDHRHDGR